MSFFYPPARTRAQIKFYAQILQVAAVVLGGGWALWSYAQQLQAPYDEKQLNLYLVLLRHKFRFAVLPWRQHGHRGRVPTIA